MPVLIICKFKEKKKKNNQERWRHRFTHYKLHVMGFTQVNGCFLLPWKPGFWSNLSQNLMQPFPHPNDASYKFDQHWPTGLRDIQVSSELWQNDRTAEWQNHRIPKGQGKSSIAPTFSKRGYNHLFLSSQLLSMWVLLESIDRYTRYM